MVAIVGTVTLVRMPVDLFPADQYSGGRGGDILFGNAAGADRNRHHRSASNDSSPWAAASITSSRARLPGVSLIKIYFQPGTNADADLSEISNLAMADLRSFRRAHCRRWC